jgi:hypothetical protein
VQVRFNPVEKASLGSYAGIGIPLLGCEIGLQQFRE